MAHAPSSHADGTPRYGFLSLFVIVAVVVGVNYAISAATTSSVSGWYVGLEKPAMTPPSIVFAIVWPMLYVTIALSLWFYLRAGAQAAGLAFWGAQFVANAAWPLMFFVAQSLVYGAYGAVLVLTLVAAVMAVFWRRSRIASLLLTPYLLWSCMAVYLGFAMWRLNA